VTEKELEELRYDVAHYLLSRMSKGSQYQYALDKMLNMCADYSEDQMKKILPKSKPKKKKSKGGGF
tara:strand:- start:47 stop:244 length:198 start_codon:yes stop_codon:yes gene_type:complete